ncbi:MAG: RrF2 family transcriptional regulator [Anaerolineae bacterium]|jgi:Rrf2 family iron-sulfur cluster assembly transcriptional regulator
MRLSTVGRYALRAMVDLACFGTDGPVPRYEVAARQEVSEQYLAQLFLKLKHAGLVDSVRGPGGGYLLARGAGTITAGEVLRAVEETLAPVFCVGDEEDMSCPRADGCPTHWLWERLGETIRQTLDSVTLSELCAHARWDVPRDEAAPDQVLTHSGKQGAMDVQ